MPRILVTGAAGSVAGMVRPYLLKKFGELVLSDRRPVADMAPGETFRPAELGDRAAVEAMLDGIDGVVHLGGQPMDMTDGPWEQLLPEMVSNLHLFYETCRKKGVQRIVYSSSVHATGFYPTTRRIGIDHRLRPDGFYGVCKAAGEALSSLYADKYGLRTLSARIGNVNLEPIDERRLSIWVHPEDLAQVCIIGLEHPGIHNQIVWAASDNVRGWWDNREAFDLGYRPKHRSEDYAAKALAATVKDPIGDQFQGGGYCSDDFDGDEERTKWH